MAVSEEKLSNNADKQNKEPFRSREKKEKPMTKVIVRRLPPSLDLEAFLNHVSPLPDHDYIYVVKGDMSLGENAFARAYINFVNFSDIFLFKEKFDNYVFVDHKGHEYPAVVEFSSFQKIPRKRKPRSDSKSGIITSDPYYLEFLESLKEVPAACEEKPEYSYQFADKVEVASTPLLDFVKQKRVDRQRVREERREERKKRELERKKFRDDEYRRKIESKVPSKSFKVVSNPRKVEISESIKEDLDEAGDAKVDFTEVKENVTSEKKDNLVPPFKKESKYEEKSFYKGKPRFEKKNDFKNNKREDFKEKEFRNRRFDDYKKEVDTTPRRAKKYSEKREERRNEAKKAEQKRVEESSDNVNSKVETKKAESKNYNTESNSKFSAKAEVVNKTESKVEDCLKEENYDDKDKLRDNDPRSNRRIKNKDRPTMAIYQPGMRSRRRPVEDIDKD